MNAPLQKGRLGRGLASLIGEPVQGQPALPPEERSPRGYTTDRVLIDACRPFKWMDEFPAVNAFTREYKDRIAAKYKI